MLFACTSNYVARQQFRPANVETRQNMPMFMFCLAFLVVSLQVPVKEGGTILGGQGEPPDSSSGAFEDIKPR